MKIGRKVTATKEVTWDMAHMLANHPGLCLNVHGHTYKMQVTVQRNTLEQLSEDSEDEGMITDFKNLKEIVKELITDRLDHAFMYWLYSPDKVEQEIYKLLNGAGRKIVGVPYRPTAENMAFDFFHRLNEHLVEIEASYQVVNLKVWETPTSFAEVSI